MTFERRLAEARSAGLIPRPVPQTPGRLLHFDPSASLSDGAAQVASEGFFDADNTPPEDTWVDFVEKPEGRWTAFDSYLVCWIPAELVEAAIAGIEANPEECLRWA
jgi:hypothetical protein